MFVYLFPYFPLRQRTEIGPWELIPRDSLDDADAISSADAARARGLLALYQVPDSRMGCFIARSDGRLGDELDTDQLLSFRKALTVAALHSNPEIVEAGRRFDAARAVTSDHTVVFGHNVDEDGHAVARFGVLIETLEGGLNVYEPDEYGIRPPIELSSASWPQILDREYAAAAYEVVSRPRRESRRVAAAIDWLDFAWRNTTSITVDSRIIGIRNGFEDLFGHVGAGGLARKLKELLETGNEAVAPCEYDDGAEPVTELACWAAGFSKLRDKITHGTPRSRADYEFRGLDHFWLGQARLRAAIRKTIAGLGHDELLGPSLADRQAAGLLQAAIEQDRAAGIEPFAPPA